MVMFDKQAKSMMLNLFRFPPVNQLKIVFTCSIFDLPLQLAGFFPVSPY